MTEFVWLLVGLLLDGCIGIGILCCIQINRIGYYEQEIRRLKEQIDRKENSYLDQKSIKTVSIAP